MIGMEGPCHGPMKLCYPGRRSKRAGIVSLAVFLIILTTFSGVLTVIPGLVNTYFPWLPGTSPSSAKGGNSSPSQSGPGTSLQPGSIGTTSTAQPSMSQVVDGSQQPHLALTTDAFMYQTPYGIYSFNRSSPFIFSIRTVSGGVLAKTSFFFVKAGGVPLTSGSFSVNTSTDSQFSVSYDVMWNGVNVGQLLLTVDFYASSRPKFTISFAESTSWGLGDFNIVWATFTTDPWSRAAGRPIVDISKFSAPRFAVGLSRVDVGPSNDPSTWTEWLTTDWSDSSGGSLQEGLIRVAGLMGIGHEVIFGKDQATIDPTQVTTSNVNFATGYSTQRKTFYYAGKYYLFYYSGSNILMKSSIDQVNWSGVYTEGGGTCWGGAIGYSFDVAQSGANVALVWLYYNSSSTGDHTTALYFKHGLIIAGDIYWFSCVKVANFSNNPYSWPPSVTIGSDGTYWVGGIWYDSSLNYNIWIYKSTDGSTFSLSTNYYTSSSNSRDDALQLIPMKTGQIMSLTSHYYDNSIRWRIWNPLAPGGGSWSSTQTLNVNFPTYTVKWNLMSATTTPDSNVHMIFEQYTTTYQIVESYYNITSASWTTGSSIYSCATQCLYPTITSDSLGNLYGFWMNMSSGVPTSLNYATKLYRQNWSAASQPFGSGSTVQSALFLSATRTTSKEIALAWTQNATSSPYKIFLGTIPLPSGVSSGPPLRPWSSIGLTPYEQYFTQNGEYLSPGNGLLTVSQTDISVQGRNGLTLAITRVYSQPFSFLSNSPLNYETSPYANLGNGWQLNLPWVGSQYLHFLNGEIFPLAWTSFNQTSNTLTLENHQTEDFVLTKTTTAYTLTTKDGTVYNFNSSGSLTSIVDRTGQNQISFNYSSGHLSTITDTVGRTATLKYNTGSQLANVTYGGQTVKYGYTGSDLTSVTDAVFRVISLKYTGANNWLLTGVVNTAGGNSTYAYGSVAVGTDALNYYVTLQNVYTPGAIVKTSSFSYNVTDGEITSSNVKQSDGFNVQGYTNYVFNAKSNSLTRTILNGTQTQMLKTQFWFDPISGRSVQQDIYSGTSISRSFYNSQFFDQWGNIIYTRDNTGHESYQSFANTNTQWTFQSPGSIPTTTNGRIFYDDFVGPSLNSTAWSTGGSGTNLATSVSGSLLKLQAKSSTSGTTQSDWIRSASTFSYPFYAEVQMQKLNGDGTGTVEFILSPQQTGSAGDPFNNNDALRLSISDGPNYYVKTNVGGVTTTVWSGGAGGMHSLVWKIALTDRNTLKVYLQEWNSPNYQLVYSTTSLGLSTSFTPSYAYLVFENPTTTTYYSTFDYFGLSGSNMITVNNLQSNQKVEVYDWNNVLQTSGTVASGQTSLTLNATQMVFPYGYFRVYELDGRSAQFTSATREVWGGSTYSYTSPFRSGGVARTSTGFLSNTSKYVDDSLPTGAVTYSDGGDAWVWTSGLVVPTIGDESAYSESLHVSQPVAGTHEHYFNASSQTLSATSGSFLSQYVYIPSTSVPSEIMLQFHTVGGTWEHRAYWGGNLITACGTAGSTCGTNGTASRFFMGAIPSIQNAWIELIVKTDDVGVNGLNLDGWGYTLYNGAVYWDESDLAPSSVGTITVNNLISGSPGQKVELYNAAGSLRASATVTFRATSITLNTYSTGINAFPFYGSMKIYSTNGPIQYSGPLMTDIWGGDVYNYNQPVFTNTFNPGSVASAIHNTQMGAAQYQNATSIPEESYSNYDSAADLLQSSQVHNTIAFQSASSQPYKSASSGTLSMLFVKGDVVALVISVQGGTFGSVSSVSDSLGNSYYHWGTDTSGGLAIDIWSTTVSTGGSGTITVTLNNLTTQFVIAASQYSGVQSIGVVAFNAGNCCSIIDTNQYIQAFSSAAGIHWGIGFGGAQGSATMSQDIGTLRTSAVTSNGSSDTSAGIADLTGISNTIVDPEISLSAAESSFGAFMDLQPYTPLTMTNTYDSYGNRLSSINADNEKTYNAFSVTYQYAYLTNTTRVLTSSVNITTSYVYNFATGMKTAIIDPMGNRTDLQFDAINRVTVLKQQSINGTRTEVDTTYQDSSNNFYIKNQKGNYTLTQYNGLGLTNSTKTYSGSLSSSILATENATYNWLNTAKTLTLPNGNTTTYLYDYLGRLVKTTNPDGTYKSVSYNDVGLVESDFDENGHRTDYLYDALHRLIGVRQYYSVNASYLTSYFYDGIGNLAKVLDPNGLVTTRTYDDLNRLILTKYPDGFNETKAYDSVGNLLSKKDANGNTISYSYDNLNRLTKTTYPDTSNASYSYDRNGNQLSWSYLGNSATFVYDSRNRLIKETYTIGGTQYTATYSYDSVGNVVGMTYPDGTSISYSIDQLNDVSSVKSGSTTLATITYTAGNRVTTITYGNGIVTTDTYDARNRITRMKTVQGSSVLLDLNYTYDAASNVVGINTESYSYDSLNRLTYSSGPWSTIQYGYDGVGNRLWTKQGSTNSTYIYGSYYRLTSVASNTYTYDNNGNQKTLATGGVTDTYNYDFENRLVNITQGSSALGKYAYDPNGVRLQKTEGGITTVFLNQGVNVFYEKQTSGGATTNDYVFDNGLLISKLSSGTAYYFHTDLLGSVRLVTTGSTNSFSTNYQPFGAQYGTSGTDPTYKYTGKPQDTATGLYYYSARYYDDSVGRFTARDPALCSGSAATNPQDLDPYAYVRNNPETFTDPSGACLKAIDLAGDILGFILTLLGTRAPDFWNFQQQLFWNYVLPAVGAINHGDFWGFIWANLPWLIWNIVVKLVYHMSWWQVGFMLAQVGSGTWQFRLAYGLINLFWSLMWQFLTPPSPPWICSDWWNWY